MASEKKSNLNRETTSDIDIYLRTNVVGQGRQNNLVRPL